MSSNLSHTGTTPLHYRFPRVLALMIRSDSGSRASTQRRMSDASSQFQSDTVSEPASDFTDSPSPPESTLHFQPTRCKPNAFSYSLSTFSRTDRVKLIRHRGIKVAILGPPSQHSRVFIRVHCVRVISMLYTKAR